MPNGWPCSRPRSPSWLPRSSFSTGFDPSNDTGFQLVEEGEWLLGLQLQDGRRRDLGPVCDADHLHHAACDSGPASWDVNTRVKEYMIAFPGAGNAHAGRVHGAGPGAVLPVLRGRPDPDVPDHRHLGRRQPDLCELQVLPLYLPRIGPDACRHGRHVCGCRHHRHPEALAEPQFSGPKPSACWASRSSAGLQTLMFLAFFASFAVKMPMWPVHTWLPDAHVQAPTAGSSCWRRSF